MKAEELPALNPKSVHPEQYKQMFMQFLQRDHCISKTLDIVEAQDERGKHYSLWINIQDLIEFDSKLSYLVLHYPELLLPIFDDSLYETQQKLMPFVVSKGRGRKRKYKEIGADKEKPEEWGTPKERCHIRITHLPRTGPDLCKANISGLRSSDVGKLIQVSGTVIRAGPVKMLQVSTMYQCQSKKCNHQFRLYADMEQGNILVPPQVCPKANNPENPKKACHSASFLEVKGSQEYADYQELKIQEEVHRLEVGSIPRCVIVLLRDDLVDVPKAGDDIMVVGVLMRRWQPVYTGVRCDVDQVLRANSVTICNRTDHLHQVSDDMVQEFQQHWAANGDSPLAARDTILSSICPQIYGMFTVKLAIVLTMIGGVCEVDSRGLRRRGQPHLLLVGDPGTGKSQFLRYAAKLSPRAVVTTGVGTTSAGLTCTAVKDGADWGLEAGALVLADRGLCCIDEFSSIKERDRVTIHEAMEQQTLSVAKAGLVCKLNTRTTVIAVTNPKGTYDTTADLTVNTAIDSPLLSRFDLVLVLLDTKDEGWDEVVSSFILRSAMGSGQENSTDSKPKSVEEMNDEVKRKEMPSQDTPSASTCDEELWRIDKLQKYIIYVKEHFQPAMTPGAEAVLLNYYQGQRRKSERSVARTTVRLLESLVRLAQAHARLMFRNKVLVQDAVIAVLAVENSMNTGSLLSVDSVLHSEFPQNPDEEYKTQEQIVLAQLQLRAKDLKHD